MKQKEIPRVALLFAQFAAYHVDRCEAVAKRLEGRAEVLAVEVATSSKTNAWAPSGPVKGATKLTLFPGVGYDAIKWPLRLWAQLRALWRCQVVLVGIGYNEPDIVILAWLLHLLGVQVVLMTESKFDDRSRRAGFELFKASLLAPYSAAIVGGPRQIEYMRHLGFRNRRVLPGYDTVGVERILAMGGGVSAPEGVAFSERSFVYVGRFVAKKNLFELVEAYALYAATTQSTPRRLLLIGSGQQECSLKKLVEARKLSHLIEFPGYFDPPAVARAMSSALALILPSREEQWGLVVNEALAFGLPAIVSTQVGSRDVLVRNLLNGYVIEPGSLKGFAAAFDNIASNEALWVQMSIASHSRAWLGDTERLADAVEMYLNPTAQGPCERTAAFIKEAGWPTELRSTSTAQGMH